MRRNSVLGRTARLPPKQAHGRVVHHPSSLRAPSNGVIGRGGTMPWHISADLKRFKALTMGSAMVMGRKTFESLPRVLPGRRHIVLTRDANWSAEGAEVASDVDDALRLAGENGFGDRRGGDLPAFLPLAQRIELTEVLADVDGDTFLDDLRTGEWREVWSEEHPAEDPPFRFVKPGARLARCAAARSRRRGSASAGRQGLGRRPARACRRRPCRNRSPR